MNNLKCKKIIAGIIAVLGMSTLLVSPVFAQVFAQDGLTVEFQDEPLFNEANFLPGQSVTRWVKVTNNSGQTQGIATEAINVSDPDDLGDVLNLQIMEGATERYEGSLSEFFDAGEVFLSDLGDGNNTQYDFSVTFDQGASNDLQGKSLNFNILVGFQGTEGGLPAGDSDNGGGGGGGLPPGLTILEDSIRTDPEETSVTITWNTTYFSTSQVIYGAEGESHTLDLNDATGVPPKYGYEHTTPEYNIDPMVTGNHSVTVSGLTPETTYYFRCVSHASPPSISKGYSFVTLASTDTTGETETGQEEGNEEEGNEENWGAQETSGGFTYKGDEEQEGNKGDGESAEVAQGSKKEGESWASILNREESSGEKENLLDKTSKGLASIFSAIRGFITQPTFFVTLVVLFLIVLCLIGIRRRTSSKEDDDEI